MSEWFEQRVAAPFEHLLETIPIGQEVRDLDRCKDLAVGIDGLFLRELAAQYEYWPQGSTVDGTRIDFCVRSDAATLHVAGMTWIDFDGLVFPTSASLRRRADSVSVVGYIGEVDRDTGAPPRMSRETVVVSARDPSAALPRAELMLGHRQVAIEWTKAFEVS